MPASPTSVPDVLSLIGNAPVLHGAKTAIEKLRASKSTFPMFGGGGDIGSMITQMMQDPSSILQNAMGAVSGQLSGVIGNLAGGLEAGSMLQALTGAGGLSSALSTVTGIANSLAGPAGMINIFAHAGLADSGATLPDSMSMDNFLAPANSAPIVQSILDALPNDVANDDVAAVQAHTSALQAVTARYTGATAGADNVRMSTAAVSCIFYGLSSPGVLGDTIHAMLAPAARDAVMASVAAIEQMFVNAKAAASATANSDGGLPV